MASLQPTRRTISNYCEPDWDCVHLEAQGHPHSAQEALEPIHQHCRRQSEDAFLRSFLPHSNYTFCYATPKQTRDDWLMHWSSL